MINYQRLRNVSDIKRFMKRTKHISTLRIKDNVLKRSSSSGGISIKPFSEIPEPKGLPYLGTYLDYRIGRFMFNNDMLLLKNVKRVELFMQMLIFM